MPTHKKGHDKDKYYHLAKDQGYRSRAAFKLIQINKRFDFLSKAKVCIDLCAAPGGWCQVAAKYMPSGSLILGIDLLSIRSIRNVKTVVSDITTAECRRMVVSELQGWKADVVLCDGAPNIGSAYNKDAYIQNELVIAALKTATDHLVQGGTFCTKVYRSVDYNSILWVLQQLFEDVQTMKPNSSRSQSSEIFIVCLKYTAPNYIDPKLLDPNHVFKEVIDPGLKKVNVLHKKYEQSNKRQRSGYDESLGMILKSTTTVTDFFTTKEPIQMLTDIHQIKFSEQELCQKIKSHPRTTEEIITCLDDLRLLGKLDFKKILKWRTQVRKSMNMEQRLLNKIENDKNEDHIVEVDPEFLSEDAIQAEIEQLREKASQLDRKEKKKDRKLTAKERQRQYLGMTGNSFGVGEDMELFQLNENITSSQISDVNDLQLEDIGDLFEDDNDELMLTADDIAPTIKGKKRGSSKNSIIEIVEDDLEDELELAYQRFLVGRKAKLDLKDIKSDHYNEDGNYVDHEGNNVTISSKRAKQRLESDAKLAMQDEEDALLLAESKRSKLKKQSKNTIQSEDLEAYVKLLNKSDKKKTESKDNNNDNNDNDQDSYDSSDDDDDDDEFEDPIVKDDYEDDVEEEQDHQLSQLMVSRDGLSKASKALKWFSNPIFSSSLVTNDDDHNNTTHNIEKNIKKDENKSTKDSLNSNKRKRKGIEDDDVVDDKEFTMKDMILPKTDKQIRKDKRKKDTERRERKELKHTKLLVEDDDDIHQDPSKKVNNDLIKRGVGKNGLVTKISQVGIGFEIVPAESDDLITSALHDEEKQQQQQQQSQLFPIPERVDDRMYDSDNEEYDAHDRVRTLALGTMMLRHSKKKALVDASYNRFAWNDPSNLPSWFLDDEMRHNKPQLPIPTALLEQIKSKFQKTGTKEIKKVAEARMRKRKRAATKLKAAKKQANVMAESNEVSERQKLKAISKAMKSNKLEKTNKVYVVTRKTKSGSNGTSGGGKGKLKFVDKRLKCDTRAMKKNDKKKGKKRK